ncbi:hypothetical protein SRHO_G00318070 [Serrasalmus rhombeus]
MKCFERFVMRHIKGQLPPSLDPLQFAYRSNHSTDDATSTTLHLALTHLDSKDTYVRMLFIDFSSAFNTIIPQQSDWKTEPAGTEHLPLSNHIIKFADDTIVVGLISKNDESAYREEVQQLTDWCRTNKLSLNVDKTKEMVVDFRRVRENLTWSLNTNSIAKRAQQHLYFLQRLKKAHLAPPFLTMFYRGTIESILSSCIIAWFGNCTSSDLKTVQHIVRTPVKITGVCLNSVIDIYTTHCIQKATSIVDDPIRPSH